MIRNPSSNKIFDPSTLKFKTMTTWYKITPSSIFEIDIDPSNELAQLQLHIGGFIESIRFRGLTGFVDEEGHPMCKGLDFNCLAKEIFDCDVYGVLLVKQGFKSRRIVDSFKKDLDNSDESSD